jgi:autotransporter-associated beta strand protein
VNGNGAIVNNSSTGVFPALSRLTLTGNTTVGGAGRWDLRPAGGSPDTAGFAYASLSTGGQPYSLTKIGANFIGIVSANVDPALATVNVQAGTLDLEGDLPGFGNPANNIVVSGAATLEFFNLGANLSKSIILNDNATILNGSGANSLDRPLVLNTNSSGGPANCTFNIGGSYLWMNPGVLSGAGNLVKSGTGTLRLSGTNTYRGSTTVSAGTLSLYTSGLLSNTTNILISAAGTLRAADRTDLTLTLNSGQTLQGNGTMAGILIARPGSTLMAGASPTSIGTLTVSSNITLQGSTLLKVTTSSGANDALSCYAITYGGTLTVTNIFTTPLAAGNSFRFFVASVYNGGSFSSINPAKPGPGLQWNTSNLNVNGTLAVAALPHPGIANYSFATNGTLVINGTNGVAGAAYSVLMSTNVDLPFAQWTPLSTNVLSASGNFTLTVNNAVDLTAPQSFYMVRAQ